MPFIRPARRLIQGQGGSTLIELLVAMPLAVLLLGLALDALGNAGHQQRDIERHTVALTEGQIGLERMTREARQAEWVYLRHSAVVDMSVRVRPTPAGTGVMRLVRYDCTGSACMRLEGPAVSYPPPAAPVFETSSRLVGAPEGDAGTRYGRLVRHDVFTPLRTDPETGLSAPDFSAPNFLSIRLRLAVEGRRLPIQLDDGVHLRRRGTS